MSIILGALAALSAFLNLWQWVAALRFPLHRRVRDHSFAPAVTLLKPLKGCDDNTRRCLQSWLAQDYAGPVQILFGVRSADDPVCAIVKQLLAENPQANAQLVICRETLGINAKVSSLIQLQRLAQNEITIISDADVLAPPDFLQNVVAPFRNTFLQHQNSNVESINHSKPSGFPLPSTGRGIEGEGCENPLTSKSTEQADSLPNSVGLVNCFYRLANPSTPAMRWEAVAVNADFWSQVLQSQTLEPLDFALGAVIAVRRESLEKLGGFTALADYLADDYQLGNRLVRMTGQHIAICPVVVDCLDAPIGWRAAWAHQLRWARTIRVSKPAPYFLSMLSNATLWPLLWAIVAPSKISLIAFVLFLFARIVNAQTLQERLGRVPGQLRYFWLVPVKDLFQFAIWASAFFGNHIIWRGERFRLQRNGRLTRL